MQFKIPQNVDIDDKIVSFLTMKQLIILVCWWTFSYFIFILFTKLWISGWISWPLVLILTLLTFAIAFLNINHLPFHRWIILWLASFIIPQKRYWYNGYVWSIYLNAFTKVSVNTKNKIEKIENEKKDFDINEVESSIWNTWSINKQVSSSTFELDDDDKKEFYNRFK